MGFWSSIKMLLREWLCVRRDIDVEQQLIDSRPPDKEVVCNGELYLLYVDDLFINLYLMSPARTYMFQLPTGEYIVVLSTPVLNSQYLKTILLTNRELYRLKYFNKMGAINTFKFLFAPYRIDRHRIADICVADKIGYTKTIDALYALKGINTDVVESKIIDSRIRFLYDSLYINTEVSGGKSRDLK